MTCCVVSSEWVNLPKAPLHDHLSADPLVSVHIQVAEVAVEWSRMECWGTVVRSMLCQVWEWSLAVRTRGPELEHGALAAF